MSAAAGGTCSILCTNPLWVIKTRLMSQRVALTKNPSREYQSAVDVAWKMYSREGMASFYSGLTPALLGVTHLAIQFPLYEQFKRYLTGSGLGSWHEDQGWLQVLGILTASSASKVCATLATYPHEVIRTRLQMQQNVHRVTQGHPVGLDRSLSGSDRGSHRENRFNGGRPRKKNPLLYRGVIGTVETVLREEGWRALYSGLGTSLIGAIPASAAAMLVYEAVVRLLNAKAGSMRTGTTQTMS